MTGMGSFTSAKSRKPLALGPERVTLVETAPQKRNTASGARKLALADAGKV
jgi:hypothetical protein